MNDEDIPTEPAAPPPSAARPSNASARPSAAQQNAQLSKLREANAKYKNLLKLAKERIQEQEGILEGKRCELICLFR